MSSGKNLGMLCYISIYNIKLPWQRWHGNAAVKKKKKKYAVIEVQIVQVDKWLV